jgi:hypothetical protein
LSTNDSSSLEHSIHPVSSHPRSAPSTYNAPKKSHKRLWSSARGVVCTRLPPVAGFSICTGEPHAIRSVIGGVCTAHLSVSSCKRQGEGRYHRAHILFLLHAHLPNKAIRHAPRHISPNAPSTTFSSAFRIELLNINSCAISSTKPV